jgi:predicted ATPase/class 3 adenylate cyclase
MPPNTALVTYLFTDIEGSSLLWERQRDRMGAALARHDEITRAAVEGHCGTVVKMVGDGAHAAFADPLDAIAATVELQRKLADPGATNDIALRVRCGIHVGADERRDDDFFGPSVNRAARIMGAAHGGQVLLSEAVAGVVRGLLPPGCALRDLGSVRLRDLALPERVHQLIAPGLGDEFPPLRSLDSTPNNLPLQLTSFIGREHELVAVRKLLATTRLLTLMGPGGIGKTRLSLQASSGLLDEYPAGIWFVELAPLSDARLVPQAVASVLGVREDAERSLVDAIRALASGRRMLLVLDNCEHVIGPCSGLVTRLLASTASLRVLASSREPLRVPGETTYTVPPLSMPTRHATLTVASLQQYEAARLFIDRVLAVQPGSQLTDRGALAVADICERLDGIPLAIELAAVHARVLSAEAIAERLIDRLRLLKRGSRTAESRQQTLRASIDWSYELLTPQERSLLRRLAVFAGDWTMDAAEAIAADEDTEVVVHDVFDLLSSLIEKSLVNRDASGSRYRLLNTVREYAQERLSEAGEDLATRSRHLAYYSRVVERASEDDRSPSDRFVKLETERENLFVAFESCGLVQGGAEAGLRLARLLKPWLLSRGFLVLGYRLMVEAVGRSHSQEHALARSQVLLDAGELAFLTGRYDAAKQHTEESLALARQIDDRAGIAKALRSLGFVFLAYREGDAARKNFEAALVVARDLGDKSQLAAALNGLGEFHRSVKDWPSALPLYSEAIALDREVGNRRRLAVHLCNLAGVLVASGERTSVPILLEALAIAEEISSKQVGRAVLEYCACLAAVCEAWENAACLYGAAERHSEEMGYHREPMDADVLPPLLARIRAALDGAAFASAEAIGRARSYEEAVAEARAWLRQASVLGVLPASTLPASRS